MLVGRKGRAWKKALNSIWRGIGAYTVAGNLYPSWTWGGSEWNRGDAPSRKYQIPLPIRSFPAWGRKAQEGDPELSRRIVRLQPQQKGNFKLASFLFRYHFLGSCKKV